MTRFLISLNTSVWLLCLLLCMLFAGAFIMPGAEEFQSIHSMPMIEWLQEQPLGVTWWLWLSIVILAALTANTFFCSVDSVIKKRKVSHWLLIISPQIIHAGFLFILLAHFFSSTGGFKGMMAVSEGTVVDITDKTVLRIKKIDISTDSLGYIRDWVVDVDYMSEGRVVKEDRLMPNSPSFISGNGVYVKDLRAYPQKAILIEICREPGAIWALIGGVLFMAGTVMLIILKMRRDR